MHEAVWNCELIFQTKINQCYSSPESTDKTSNFTSQIKENKLKLTKTVFVRLSNIQPLIHRGEVKGLFLAAIHYYRKDLYRERPFV